MPERWVIVGHDAAWCEIATQRLKDVAARESAHSFMRWRIRFGLIRIVAADLADQAIEEAARGTAEGRSGPMELWAALSPTQWRECARNCHSLRLPALRGLRVQYLPPGLATACDLDGLWHALRVPDTWIELHWLTHGRILPVPRSWTAIAALPGQQLDVHQAMAEEAHSAFQAWAQALIDGADSADLAAIWGPFTGEEDDPDDWGAEQAHRSSGEVFELTPGEATAGTGASDRSAFDRLRTGTRIGSRQLPRLGGHSTVLHAWLIGKRMSRRLVLHQQGGGDCLFDLFDPELAARAAQVQLQVLMPGCRPWLLRGADFGGASLRFLLPRDRWPEALGHEVDPSRFAAWLREQAPLARIGLLQVARPLVQP